MRSTSAREVRLLDDWYMQKAKEEEGETSGEAKVECL